MYGKFVYYVNNVDEPIIIPFTEDIENIADVEDNRMEEEYLRNRYIDHYDGCLHNPHSEHYDQWNHSNTPFGQFDNYSQTSHKDFCQHNNIFSGNCE
jgi:hypothetical protein